MFVTPPPPPPHLRGFRASLKLWSIPNHNWRIFLMTPPSIMPPAVDPDNVPETFCAGKFNIAFATGGYATLTFTHTRPKAGPLLDSSQIDEESVVRARVAMPMDNFVALRDLLNNLIKDQPAGPTTVTGGAGKPH
jgi:hypothetical protein